jgi:hypothetical protein
MSTRCVVTDQADLGTEEAAKSPAQQFVYRKATETVLKVINAGAVFSPRVRSDPLAGFRGRLCQFSSAIWTASDSDARTRPPPAYATSPFQLRSLASRAVRPANPRAEG